MSPENLPPSLEYYLGPYRGDHCSRVARSAAASMNEAQRASLTVISPAREGHQRAVCRQGLGHGFLDERFSGPEVTVEAAVGEPGAAHARWPDER